MLVVTHEMGFARNVSNKVVFMEDGVVVEAAPSQEFFRAPKQQRTKAFLQMIEQHGIFCLMPARQGKTAANTPMYKT